MSFWSALSTLMILPPPAGVQLSRVGGQPISAVGSGKLLSDEQYRDIWSAFFPQSSGLSQCGFPIELRDRDADWISRDAFLVNLRGFRASMCQSTSWFVASMRIDPCRLRLRIENKSQAEIQKCSLQGKFSEVRFVLQPVEKTDREYVFPDAALHIAFSFSNSDFRKIAADWRNRNPEHLIALTHKFGRFNDAALFIGAGGLERWTFARIRYSQGAWARDRLSHGGYYESISDAEMGYSSVRTGRPVNEEKFSEGELLNPLRINPLQGSCIDCHLAERSRPHRMFRQLGWGLSGEAVISERVRAEAEFAARELKIIEGGQK